MLVEIRFFWHITQNDALKSEILMAHFHESINSFVDWAIVSGRFDYNFCISDREIFVTKFVIDIIDKV